MTDEKIFELAKSCGFEGVFYEGEPVYPWHYGSMNSRWECDEDKLLEFARLIHNMTLEAKL